MNYYDTADLSALQEVYILGDPADPRTLQVFDDHERQIDNIQAMQVTMDANKRTEADLVLLEPNPPRGAVVNTKRHRVLVCKPKRHVRKQYAAESLAIECGDSPTEWRRYLRDPAADKLRGKHVVVVELERRDDPVTNTVRLSASCDFYIVQASGTLMPRSVATLQGSRLIDAHLLATHKDPALFFLSEVGMLGALVGTDLFRGMGQNLFATGGPVPNPGASMFPPGLQPFVQPSPQPFVKPTKKPSGAGAVWKVAKQTNVNVPTDPSKNCPECGGSGEWENPLTGKRSPCKTCKP